MNKIYVSYTFSSCTNCNIVWDYEQEKWDGNLCSFEPIQVYNYSYLWVRLQWIDLSIFYLMWPVNSISICHGRFLNYIHVAPHLSMSCWLQYKSYISGDQQAWHSPHENYEVGNCHSLVIHCTISQAAQYYHHKQTVITTQRTEWSKIEYSRMHRDNYKNWEIQRLSTHPRMNRDDRQREKKKKSTVETPATGGRRRDPS